MTAFYQNTDKVVCVIVTYNRKALLQECLDAVLAQSYPLYRIIVFNNCSTDGTERLFGNGAQYCLDEIILVSSKKNLGGAGGFSSGMRAASMLDCDWVWVMDDDTIPDKDALEQLVNASQKLSDNGETVGFLASSAYSISGAPINVPKIDDAECPNGYQSWHRYLEDGVVRVKEATFVSVLFSNEAVRKVGFPIAEYFIWGDDTEYTRRVVRDFGTGYLCGASRVLHKRFNENKITILDENEKSRVQVYRYYYRNALLNAAKYEGRIRTAGRWMYYFVFSFYCMMRPREKYRFAKFAAVQKGIWMFVFLIVSRETLI